MVCEMSDIGDWYRQIKSVTIRKKLKQEKRCYISARSNVDYGTCVFEGNNQIGKFTIMHHCIMGLGSYVSESSVLERVEIGRYCSVGPHVHIINGRHPARDYVSTHPVFYAKETPIKKSFVKENRFEEFVYADKERKLFVEVGNDVWIGDGASIMEGVRIADGTIIAAGAVVVKDTQPYEIIGGNPAKHIRYRFEQEDIEFLLDIQWWKHDEEWIRQYADEFDNIKKLKSVLLKEK